MKTAKDLQRVEDKRQLKQLMYENLRRFPRWETNCIFEPGEVDRLLRRKSLYAGACPAGLYLLDDEGDYYRVHFFFSVDAPVDFSPMDKPVLVEFLVTRGKRSAAIAEMEQKWLAAGFREHVKDLKLYLSLKDYPLRPAVVENAAGRFIARPARAEDAAQILPIWDAALDHLNSAIPSMEELLYEINEGNIFVVDREGEVCAANKMVIRGGMVSTWLGAVKPEYRRMGLSTAMKHRIYKTAMERGVFLCYTWVDENNAASRAALAKLGFVHRGEWTEGFLLDAAAPGVSRE